MAVPVFTVKVHLSCCSRCTLRAKEKLQKIKGVNSITIDTAKDLVIVSGSVEPGVILEKFAEWGKKAELFSFQKEPMESGGGHDKDETNLNKNYYRKSDSVPGAVPANRFLHDNPNMYVARDSKKGKWCWLGKIIFGNKPRARSLVAEANADNKWHAPRIPMNEFGSSKPIYGNQLAMHEFGSSQPFYGSQLPMDQFGSSRPFNGSHFNRPISMYGRPRQPVPPQPMYMPRPPFLPPYGGMQPGAAAAPSHSVNPMIHYTSYDDNYRHW